MDLTTEWIITHVHNSNQSFLSSVWNKCASRLYGKFQDILKNQGKLQGLCKVHKPDMAFWPIVSMPNRIEYNFCKTFGEDDQTKYPFR